MLVPLQLFHGNQTESLVVRNSLKFLLESLSYFLGIVPKVRHGVVKFVRLEGKFAYLRGNDHLMHAGERIAEDRSTSRRTTGCSRQVATSVLRLSTMGREAGLKIYMMKS